MKIPYKSPLLTKALALLAILLALCLPLSQINGLVQERGRSQQEAVAELAETYAGPQTLTGPLLVLPYTERWLEPQHDVDGKARPPIARAKTLHHIVFPEALDVTGEMAPQERYRGLFKVLFYDFTARLSGHFAPFSVAELAHSEKDSSFEWQTPTLVFSLSDMRGLMGSPQLVMADERLRFAPGVPAASPGSRLDRGIQAPLTGSALQTFGRGQALPFELRLTMVGQQTLAIVPVGQDTTAHLKSPWPHPSFGGRFLATQRLVRPEGFDASWQISSLNSSARLQVLDAMASAAPSGQLSPVLETFDVTLAQPLNPYAISNRAVKYGALFVGLTLMACFMFELFRHLRLHPVQYGLVGLSIALFFLLLLALSEKVAFLSAYAGAALASVMLLGVYFSGVLRSWRRGLSLATFVGLLYAALYGLLVSQDNALLLGSLLSFGMLAALMLLTRRLDWYALGDNASTTAHALPDTERGALA